MILTLSLHLKLHSASKTWPSQRGLACQLYFGLHCFSHANRRRLIPNREEWQWLWLKVLWKQLLMNELALITDGHRPARLIISAFGIGKLTHVCHANWRDSANSLRTRPLLLIAPSADGTRLVVFLYPLVCLCGGVWVGVCVCELWVIPRTKLSWEFLG